LPIAYSLKVEAKGGRQESLAVIASATLISHSIVFITGNVVPWQKWN